MTWIDDKIEKIKLEETPHNDHGCDGFWADIMVTSERTGTIVHSYRCGANCHGMPVRNWLKEGQKVMLPPQCISWEDAREWTSDDTSFSNAGCTKLLPDDLIIVQ